MTTQSRGRASRAKGQRGEREVAKLIQEHLGHECRRGFQARGGSEEADVLGLPGHHVEVKRQERVNIWAAMRQAEADCDEEVVPVVFTRKNGEPWLVVMWAADYLRGLRR